MAKVLICGMTPSTARRYVVVRAEIDLIIERVHKAGQWLSDLEKLRPGDHQKIVIKMGRSIMSATAQVQDYLENEFVSVEKIRAKADEFTKIKD